MFICSFCTILKMKWMMVVTLLLRIVSSEVNQIGDDSSNERFGRRRVETSVLFSGNSVTRSYAFTLCSMLSKIDYIPDRFIQRDLCGNSNFPHPERFAPEDVVECGDVSCLYWKNTVSSIFLQIFAMCVRYLRI